MNTIDKLQLKDKVEEWLEVKDVPATLYNVLTALDVMGYLNRKEEDTMKEKGFTLIEVLIVLVMMGIVAAIFIPPIVRYFAS